MRAALAPFRARLVLVVTAVLVTTGCAGAAPAPFEADLLLNEGPGASATEFHVRGRTLTAILPSGLDGAAAGVFRAALADHDPLLDALAKMPASLGGPPPMAGMPSISIEVRDARGTHRLVGARPASDAWLIAVTNALARSEAAARRGPVATIRAEVSVDAAAPSRAVVRLVVSGASAQAVIDPALLRLETAPPATPARAGITPLPPVWTPAGRAAPRSSSRTITAKAPLEARLAPTGHGPRALRAIYAGPVKLTAASETHPLTVDLSSAVSTLRR